MTARPTIIPAQPPIAPELAITKEPLYEGEPILAIAAGRILKVERKG